MNHGRRRAASRNGRRPSGVRRVPGGPGDPRRLAPGATPATRADGTEDCHLTRPASVTRRGFWHDSAPGAAVSHRSWPAGGTRGHGLAPLSAREYGCRVRTPARLLLAVFLGGALGTLARVWLGSVVSTATMQQGSANLVELSAGSVHVLDADIVAALIANLAGSLALGIVAGAHWPAQRAAWRAALGPGFCGGFTTFSLIALALALVFSTSAWAIAAFVLGTLGGVLAIILGRALGRRIAPPPAMGGAS
ncbi:CrcB family protein [Pseudoclavibacter terrae]|uniref:Fluoride-specific ion channel n=1 Tax=Pseudoclavibacter terrae TaxID=1530195 RepID=A0A7J5B4K0_9MICO|nr:CrcB family protein [Pseudoclavibacter terrae]